MSHWNTAGGMMSCSQGGLVWHGTGRWLMPQHQQVPLDPWGGQGVLAEHEGQPACRERSARAH